MLKIGALELCYTVECWRKAVGVALPVEGAAVDSESLPSVSRLSHPLQFPHPALSLSSHTHTHLTPSLSPAAVPPPPMSNLAFPAGPSRTSSSATSTKTTGNSLGPTRSWRSKWYASLVLCGALVATVAWIAAALYLWHRDLYLPLNYFDNIQGTRGWLSNGGYK